MAIMIQAFRFTEVRERRYEEHLFSLTDIPPWFNWWECSGFSIFVDGINMGGYHRCWLLTPESDALGDEGIPVLQKLVWLADLEGDDKLEWLDSTLNQNTNYGAEMSDFIRTFTEETDLILYKSGIYAYKPAWKGGDPEC